MAITHFLGCGLPNVSHQAQTKTYSNLSSIPEPRIIPQNATVFKIGTLAYHGNSQASMAVNIDGIATTLSHSLFVSRGCSLLSGDRQLVKNSFGHFYSEGCTLYVRPRIEKLALKLILENDSVTSDLINKIKLNSNGYPLTSRDIEIRKEYGYFLACTDERCEWVPSENAF